VRRNSFSTPSSGRGGKVFRKSRFTGNTGRKHGRYIDPDKFINKAVITAEPERFVPEHQFGDFGFDQALLQNVTRKGYTHPTRIQDASIKPAMAGRDLIGLANTGSGKTAAFVLPIIHRLSQKRDGQTVLIIAPTRELAEQIFTEFNQFARGLNLFAALCVGGVNMGRQIERLRRRPQVVIGTPGRLKDLYQQNVLKLARTHTLVLDEADRMLDMGFIRDIRFLIDKLPEQRQTLCFSATMPLEIQSLVKEILKDPVTVSARTTETSDHIEQDVIYAGSKDEKMELLKQLLRQDGFEKVIIFGEAKYAVQRLSDNLAKSGFKAAAIHGNKSQPQRTRALNDFKSGKVSVLVATDVASRGLDIPKVSHVINFDQPATYEDYIHRIGRTGRAGQPGQALTFVAK
jgi:ATP-dependent RNA helicase RhlE